MTNDVHITFRIFYSVIGTVVFSMMSATLTINLAIRDTLTHKIDSSVSSITTRINHLSTDIDIIQQVLMEYESDKPDPNHIMTTEYKVNSGLLPLLD